MTMTTKTVFVLPSWYPPDGGIFFKEQTEVLAKIANQVVLYPQPISVKKVLREPIQQIKKMYRIKHTSDAGVQTLSLAYIQAPRLFRVNIFFQYWFFRLLYARACRLYGKPDVLHVHSAIWAGYSAYKIGSKYKVPYIITEHRSRFVNNSYAKEAGQLPRRFHSYLKKAFSNASFIAPVSEPMIPKIRSYLGRAVAIESKPNLVNTDIFSNRGCTQLKAQKFSFITVCSLNKIKGVDVLIKAFAKMIEETGFAADLVIVGDGPDKNWLESLAIKLGVDARITFKGQQSRTEVGRLMMQSHVFVLPTRYEAFGVVFGEALMAGLPVLATRGSGGPDSIVTPGVNGHLFDIDDITQLKDLMADVYTTYDEWNLTEIAENAYEKYGKKAFMRQYEELFERIST